MATKLVLLEEMVLENQLYLKILSGLYKLNSGEYLIQK